MLTNRSAPHARIVPVLTVYDIRAAVAWYGEVFGFVEHVRIGEGHRAQLGLPAGNAELIVAEVRPGGRLPTAGRSHQVMLKVEDAAAVLAQATGRGALPTARSAIGSTASGRPPSPTPSVTSGCSPRRSPTSPPSSGAARPSRRAERRRKSG